ncbi:MAG: DJ-1/PfpI family protein, partial [Pseudomonadota bacterium]
MDVAILLYDRVTVLDAIGPYEVFNALPGATIKFVAREKGEKRADNGRLGLIADYALSEVTSPDIVIIPGTPHPDAVLGDAEALEWMRACHQNTKWTTSVCTGALGLGAAGVLQGLKATTHWMCLEMLSEFGAEPSKERVVRQGKVITAAGVSSGIDMALTLVGLEFGDEAAQMVQLAIEYDPEPPYDAGSPDKAPSPVVENLR